MPRLTKQIVDAARPKERAYFAWCSDLPGFGVRVHPTGRKAYYVDYRNLDGVRKRMTIGAHGKITTEEARKLALQTLGDAAKGEDPAQERATRRKRDHGQRAVRRLHGRRRQGPDPRQAATAQEAVYRLAGPRPHQPPYRPAARTQACPRPDPRRCGAVHPRRDSRQDGGRREDEAARQGRRHRRRGHGDTRRELPWRAPDLCRQ